MRARRFAFQKVESLFRRCFRAGTPCQKNSPWITLSTSSRVKRAERSRGYKSWGLGLDFFLGGGRLRTFVNRESTGSFDAIEDKRGDAFSYIELRYSSAANVIWQRCCIYLSFSTSEKREASIVEPSVHASIKCSGKAVYKVVIFYVR